MRITDRMLLFGKSARHEMVLPSGGLSPIHTVNDSDCKAYLSMRKLPFPQDTRGYTLRNLVTKYAEELQHSPYNLVATLLYKSGKTP